MNLTHYKNIISFFSALSLQIEYKVPLFTSFKTTTGCSVPSKVQEKYVSCYVVNGTYIISVLVFIGQETETHIQSMGIQICGRTWKPKVLTAVGC